MAISTLTKIGIVNNALNSIGERSVTTISGILGNIISSSLQEAVLFVCNQNEWRELHSISLADSWSANKATMPARTYRTTNVYWYTSPDGQPEIAYDYPKWIIKFKTYEEYETETLVPFVENGARPWVWSKLTNDVIVVNPYPNDTIARSKIFFDIYRYPVIPVGDSDSFGISDLLVNLFQYKLAELLAIKHLADLEIAASMEKLYMNYYKSHMISDSGRPSYNMYVGRRR